MISYFDNWKAKDIHKDQLFITDGVIDQDLWDKSSEKVMFLLKEAYDSKNSEGTWDLPTLIKSRGVSGRTFKPMAQWAYGIHKILKDGEVSPYVQNSEDVRQALFSSAVVNIKKSCGKKSSTTKDLEKYVNEDWSLLSSQIKDISPNIVVCGNTWSLISKNLENKSKISDRAYISDGVIYISFWHPSNRSSNLMSYYSLCAIVQMALKRSSFNL